LSEDIVGPLYEVRSQIHLGNISLMEKIDIRSSFFPKELRSVFGDANASSSKLGEVVEGALGRESATSAFEEARQKTMETLGIEELGYGENFVTDGEMAIAGKISTRSSREEFRIRMVDSLHRPTSTECSRCGSCCEAFLLPLSHRSHAAILESLERGDRLVEVEVGNGDGTYGPETREVNYRDDLLKWFTHIEPVPMEVAWSRMVITPGYYETNGINAYRCTLFERDEESGLGRCTIHEDRPRVCRDFRPSSDGGYLGGATKNPYIECSYRNRHNHQQSDVYDLAKWGFARSNPDLTPYDELYDRERVRVSDGSEEDGSKENGC